MKIECVHTKSPTVAGWYAVVNLKTKEQHIYLVEEPRFVFTRLHIDTSDRDELDCIYIDEMKGYLWSDRLEIVGVHKQDE